MTIYLCCDLLYWEVTAANVNVPVILPLFVLHPFPRSPGQRNLFTMKSKLVEVFQGSIRIHSSVHTNKGTTSR